jgi:hypothetical protein
VPDEDEEAIRAPAFDVLGADVVDGETWVEGRALSLAEAVDVASGSLRPADTALA